MASVILTEFHHVGNAILPLLPCHPAAVTHAAGASRHHLLWGFMGQAAPKGGSMGNSSVLDAALSYASRG
jgi:hypothetical protein